MIEQTGFDIQTLEMILSGNNSGIWYWDLNLNTQIWSDRFYELLGFEPREIEASSEFFINSLLHPEERIKVNNLFSDQLTSRNSFKTQVRLKIKDNQYKFFEYTGFTKHINDKPVALFGSLSDIHEQVLLKKQKVKNDRLLKRSGEMTGSGLWEIDLLTLKPEWSSQVYSIHEIDEGDALDLRQAVLFFKPWARVVIQNYIDRAAMTGMGWDLELPIQTAKGKNMWIRTICESENEDGKPVRLFGIVQELTENKQLEDKLRVIFHHSTDAHFIIDKNGVLDCNDKAVSMLQCRNKAELLRIHPARFSPEFQPDGSRSVEKSKRMDRIAYDKGTHKFEWLHKRKNGEEFPVEVTLKPVPYGNQQVLLVVWHEITLEKKAEQLIKRHEAMLAETQQLTHCGSWEADLVTRRSYISDETFRIFGLEPYVDDYSNKVLLKMVHQQDRRQLLTAIQSVINQQLPARISIRIIRADGDIRFIYIIGKPVVASSGKVTKIYGAIMDIDERTRAEQELIVAKKQAEAAEIAKSEFLYTMSHEIRTPLNAVIGFTKLLMEQDVRPQQLEDLAMLRCSSVNLLALVNDILDFKNIEAGNIIFEETEFSIKDLISDIISGYQQHAKHRNISIQTVTDDDLCKTVVGDPVRLTQILTNLLSNAIKFTESGGINIAVRIVSDDNGYRTVEFRIEDTGIGISQEKLELVFNRFTQAHSDTTRKYGGSGLGLSIVKRLLELQGSRIELESEPGRGSVFYFTLRFKKAKDPIVTSHSAGKVPVKFTSLKGMSVLIAEDNEINIILMSRLMQKWDVEFDIAENGMIAYQMVQKNNYDLILMDLQMPEMDGYEATRQIRMLPDARYRALPIVAVTASVVLDNLETVTVAGMNGFIGKPIDPVGLYDKIASYFNKVQSID